MEELAQKVKNYQVPDSAQQLVAELRLLLVAGPSGSGKSAVIAKLLESGSYDYIVSHTTRPSRTAEENGKNYYFVDQATASSMVDERRFFEAKVVYDNFLFGTSLAELQRVRESGKIGLTDIDVTGADDYVELNRNTKTVFLLPPSYDEWTRRLAERGTGEDQDTIKRRLEDAQRWLEKALRAGHWYFIINTDLDKAVAEIRAYAEDPNFEPKNDETKVEHAWHVLGELKHNLNT